MPLFLEVGTRKEAEALAPGAFIIAPVRGGYMAYRTREEVVGESARKEEEVKRLRKVIDECYQKYTEWSENLDRLHRERFALVFSCPRGYFDEDDERAIVGEVKKKKTSKKALPKKARKPAAEKRVLRVIPGGREASPEASG